jgi:hypothetical protein
MARGGRRLLRSTGRSGDTPTPTGPTGVRSLEQERGGRQAGHLGLFLVLPDSLVIRTVLYVRFLVGGVFSLLVLSR